MCDFSNLEPGADFPRSVTVLKRLFCDPLIKQETLRLWAAQEEEPRKIVGCPGRREMMLCETTGLEAGSVHWHLELFMI